MSKLLPRPIRLRLGANGFDVAPGDIGENITTRGVDLLSLPAGTRLHLGEAGVVELTGLRNPCVQLDHFQAGLMSAVLDRDADGRLIRRCGVMGIVMSDGEVRAGDPLRVEPLALPHGPLVAV